MSGGAYPVPALAGYCRDIRPPTMPHSIVKTPIIVCPSKGGTYSDDRILRAIPKLQHRCRYLFMADLYLLVSTVVVDQVPRKFIALTGLTVESVGFCWSANTVTVYGRIA